MTDEAQRLAQWCRQQIVNLNADEDFTDWHVMMIENLNAIASLLEREAPRPRESHPMIRGSLQEKLAMAEALLIKHLDELTEAERQLDEFKKAPRPREPREDSGAFFARTATTEIAAWLDDVADSAEGEPGNFAWNLQIAAKRLRELQAKAAT